jgi:hypothetical protein
MNDAIEEFMELFQGRTDAYGTWEGGSIKEPTNYKSFARHLYDEELIGIYPLKDDSTVRWGCSDIDVDEPSISTTISENTSVHRKNSSRFPCVGLCIRVDSCPNHA